VKGPNKNIKGKVIRFAFHSVSEDWKHGLGICVGMVVDVTNGTMAVKISKNRVKLYPQLIITSKIHVLPLNEELVWRIENNI
jgi:hypothetical protein